MRSPGSGLQHRPTVAILHRLDKNTVTHGVREEGLCDERSRAGRQKQEREDQFFHKEGGPAIFFGGR